MSEPVTDVAEVPEAEAAAEDRPDLGESGKKALQAERDARKQADKKAAELQAQLDAINAEKLSDLEKAQQAQAAAEEDAADARRDALRYRLASRYEISEEDAELFLTGDTEEAMTAQAERLAARQPDVRAPKPDLTQGSGQSTPFKPSAAEQFAQAFAGQV